MIRFEGMNSYEYIDCGDNWLVQFPSGTYQIGGIGDRHFNCSQQIVIQSNTEVVKVIKKPQEVLRYEDGEGTSYTLEQVQAARQKRNEYYDDEYEEYVYPDLDTEFQIRKDTAFLDSLQVIYTEPEYEYKSIELKRIGVWEDTGSKYITTPYQLGRTKFSGNTVFCLHSGKLAKDVFTDVCPQADVSGSSNLRFAKVNDEFVMYNLTNKYGWVADEAHKVYFTSLDDAKREEEDIKEIIEAHVECMLDSKRLNAQQRGVVYKEVLDIQRLAHKLDVKAKANGDKRYVLKRLQELIDNIREDGS